MKQRAANRFVLILIALLAVTSVAGVGAADAPSRITVSYDKMTFTLDGREIPIIVDYPECLDDSGRAEFLAEIKNKATRDVAAWVHLPYNRFDVFIEESYYNSYTNSESLPAFFDLFEPRYELMESVTGWSSEQSFNGLKLEIYVEETSSCGGGYALPGEAHFTLHYDFSNPDACLRPYYMDGQEYYNNPGELGDQWTYMDHALHEALHSINPLPIYARLWLTEGFAMYNMYNILTEYGDINQETSDTYIYNGNGLWNWEGYVNNDYHDNTANNLEIQESKGYDITAWMFSMLRDDYGLDMDDFYTLVNDNDESLHETWLLRPISYYFTDMVVIDLFGRALGHTDFELQTKPIWRYDGPAGPGWGVRQWESLDWYAELVPEFPSPDTTLLKGELLPVTIRNDGGVALVRVPVALYANGNLTWVDTLEVADSSSVTQYVDLGLAEGTYTLSLIVDEDNMKVESDETNNMAMGTLTVTCVCMPPIRGNVNYDPGDAIDISDLVYLVDYMFTGGPEPPCLSESDINGSGGESPMDISDLVYLVDYMFTGGPAPVACP